MFFTKSSILLFSAINMAAAIVVPVPAPVAVAGMAVKRDIYEGVSSYPQEE